MKKLFKALLVFACAGTLCAGALALSACNSGTKGESYALTHGANRFIGYATVTVKGEKVSNCTLTEVALPTQVKDADGASYVEFTYGDVTLQLDGSDYVVGTETLNAYFQTEANCKAYYEAAIGNKITGKKADGTTETVTKSVLSKEENGYWTRVEIDGEWKTDASKKDDPKAYSRWKANRDATVAYVKSHGIEGLKSLNKGSGAVTGTNVEGANVTYWTDGNSVSTGATWSDLWYTETAPTTYVTYGQLIINAYNATQK